LPSQLITNGVEGFDQLFAACAAQPTCASTHGNVRSKLDALIAAGNQQSRPVTFGSATDSHTAQITGNDMATIVWYLLGNGATVSQIPAAIDALRAGDTSVISEALSQLSTRAGSSALGTQIAVDCNDSAPVLGPADQGVIDSGGWKAGMQYFYPGVYCAAAGTKPLPDTFRRPVTSDIPTLVLAGRFDPNTAPSRSRATASRLKRATFVEIADQSHVVATNSECASTLFAAFVTDPDDTLDTGCADALTPPTFV
jgi:pimeloyl-ACP methyl ester carboxylesterase